MSECRLRHKWSNWGDPYSKGGMHWWQSRVCRKCNRIQEEIC